MIPQTVTLSLIVLKEKKNIPPLFIVCNLRRLRLMEGLQSLAERKGLGLNHASHDVSNGRDKKKISSDFLYIFIPSSVVLHACSSSDLSMRYAVSVMKRMKRVTSS